ncbi:thioredoxin-disulfide reductase [Candidatus Collierbacteria bacterium RIFOXYB2_FULL_46_14]|nr:MAG: thioredoxin-disulfide reductase [Candidatus Collierbacteria bacterium RIFOXYB2_FULL_46_14]OGD76696.1 MAG: thioredoxin-disulfide reductase [Candidatus Collierbacteria bacterium RIFOXYA2_FULL_46_20]OGD78032.1 MAG: thioredoxin-disulfide reductase [Candidatus Collierbacteria bacterium RIFOXYC2_FULL_43_15]OGD81229.1 MAG: thioredoxin-disulfide reductase [Pseudomonadales bacterium GWC2_63_15]OGD82754.1 MAG: thioredoxin-disulfide reductase [Candidatus Collierbacteria bacterium RIFOXYD2_FULL_45_
MEDKKWDVVIVGGGPSGYTAAIYLSRATLSVLVLAGTKAGGQLMNTTEVENFPGFKDGVMGPDLMMTMEAQAKKFGAEVRYEDVTKVELIGETKRVWVGDEEVKAKAVIISTGASSKMLGLGEEKWMGKGVSTCAVCDAAFFKEKISAVVGGGDAAMEDALALAKYASEVYLIHRRDSLKASKIMQERVTANPKIKIIWKSEVVEVKGSEKLEGIKIKNVETGLTTDIVVDGLFLAIGHFPATELFKGQVDLDDKGFLKTGITNGDVKVWLEGYPTMTSVDGVFGCGDVVDFKYKQAITAAGMGCQAALDAEKYLTGKTASW